MFFAKKISNFVQIKNASFEKKKKKSKMKPNFQNYPQQKIDVCILLVFCLPKQSYKPIAFA